MTTRRAAVLLSAAGLLVLAGVVTFLSAPTSTFGWSADSPLSDGDLTLAGGAVLLSRAQVLASVLVAVGLVLVAGVVGFGLGRRVPR